MKTTRGSNSLKGKSFLCSSKLPDLPPIQCTRSLGVKRPRREADHSPPSSTEVTNKWSYASSPSVCFHGVHRIQGGPFLTPCSYTCICLSIYSQNNPTHTESISKVHFGWEQLFVSYSRGHRLVLKQRPAKALRYFVVFLSTATQIPAQNITLDHDDFLPHPFQFIMHLHCAIRCCSLSYWQCGHKKQQTFKQKLTELNWDNTHLALYSSTAKPNVLPTPIG